MADQITVNTHSAHAIWQTELVVKLNDIITIAKAALIDLQSKDNPEVLQSLIDGVEVILCQIAGGTLTVPDGHISLGIGRYVSDWVDDLAGPLSKAVAASENQYLKGAAVIINHV